MADATAVAGSTQAIPRLDSAVVTRNETLDFVKGSLVLVMVLYHWLNYFVTIDWDVYRYLRFLTPSFILITGFIVSHVYLGKYSYDSPRLRSRLVQRGLKLLLLFIVLNVLVDRAAGGHANGLGPLTPSWTARANAIFIVGEGAAAFSILVPIAYFLMLAPFVLLASKRTGMSLSAIAATALAVTIGASVAGFSNSHLEFLSVALVGLAAGAVGFSRIDAMLRRPVWLVFGYLLYLAAITIWNVRFPLQVIGVCLSVALLYLIGVKWESGGVVQRHVVELGKYSLFAYITQIAALQLLRRGLRGADLVGAQLLVPFAVCLIVTVVAVRLMTEARSRSTVADSVYRTIFA